MISSRKFKIQYHGHALKFLKRISYMESKRVTDKIKKIQTKEYLKSSSLDIKKLEGTKQSYRLRVGKIRVIMKLFEKEKILYIENIDFRGNVY